MIFILWKTLEADPNLWNYLLFIIHALFTDFFLTMSDQIAWFATRDMDRVKTT